MVVFNNRHYHEKYNYINRSICMHLDSRTFCPFYPIEGWMKEPISNTFVTLYVLMFFVLILNLTKTTKIEK